ncbi:MAG: Rid family detoxifying hydrolase [Candidatus Parcubacteria bacterium]|nr:Rid family detoxifying hydrolase [Candidatus Parcubacteria bacterium]
MNKTAVIPEGSKVMGAYSPGIVANGFVFTSGQLGVDPKTGEMPEDVKAQARLALENVQAVLRAGGSDLPNVVKATVFLADIADFKAVNEVYAEMFADAKPFPARSAVQVAALPKSGAKVEIEAIGVVVSYKSLADIPRE